jgi:hypothetical protein
VVGAGDAERELADPTTSAARLAELAAADRALWPAIAAHPNVYPDLLDWMREHGGLPTAVPVLPVPAELAQAVDEPPQKARARRMRIVAIIVIAALVLSGGSVGIALAIAAANSAPAPIALPTATAAPTKAPAPKPTATPRLPADERVEPADWAAYDDVLLVPSQLINFGGMPESVYVPGEGEVDMPAVAYSEDLQASGWGFTGTPDALTLLSAYTERIPAVGITPESYELNLIALDVATGRQQEFPLGEVPGFLSVGIAGGAGPIAAISVSPDPYDPTVGSVTGINVRTGDDAWVLSPANLALGDYGFPVVRMHDGTTSPTSAFPCGDVIGVEVETGRTVWTEPDEGTCSADATPAAGYSDGWDLVQQRYVAVGRYPSESVRWFDLLTGDEVGEITDTSDLFVDPVTGLVTRGGHVGWANESVFDVVDPSTGEVLFTMDVATQQSLDFRVRALYDGLLYAETTDAAPVIDVATGEVVSEDSPWYPVARIGDWMYFSDGLLTQQPRRLAGGTVTVPSQTTTG